MTTKDLPSTRWGYALIPLALLALGIYGMVGIPAPDPVAQARQEEGSAASSSQELPIIYVAKLEFSHKVGASPCPQEAGAVSMGAFSKERSKLTELEVTGKVAPFIRVAPLAPSGEGVRITLMASFTCDRLEKGLYTGTVEATLRGLESGKSGHISLPVIGTVY